MCWVFIVWHMYFEEYTHPSWPIVIGFYYCGKVRCATNGWGMRAPYCQTQYTTWVCINCFTYTHKCFYAGCFISDILKDYKLRLRCFADMQHSCVLLLIISLYQVSRGTAVARWTVKQQVERSIMYLGHDSIQIHLISLGCPRPSTALHCTIVAENAIYEFIYCPII